MLTEFSKIFIFIILGGIFAFAAILFASLIRPKRPTHEKLTTYECGEEPIGTPWIKFNLRFYVVALIFLIFDVEIVLLFPWALSYSEHHIYGYLVGTIFIILLFIGMAYEWRKGDIEWARPKIQPPALNKILNLNSSKKEKN